MIEMVVTIAADAKHRSNLSETPGRGAGSTSRPTAASPLDILYHHRVLADDGMRVHISAIVNALTTDGHTVRLVGPDANSAQSRSVTGRLGRLRKRLPGWLGEILELGYNLPAFLRLARTIRQRRPDVLYERYNMYLLAGVWASRLWRVPLILEVNAPLADERSAEGQLALRRLGRWCERYVWRRADAVLPVSHVLKRYVQAADVPADRIQVVPNGAAAPGDPATLATRAARVRQEHCLENKLVLGFVGFVRPWHGMRHVVDALVDLQAWDPVLLIVGDGPARAEIEQRAADLGITDRVVFTGRVDHTSVPAYVATFAIALQPAVTPYASPLKLLDYAAAGCAIVAPDQANIRELVEPGVSARLVPPGDPDALRAVLRDLATAPDERRRLGEGARARIVDCGLTWQANARRIGDLGNRLRGSRP